MLQLTEATIGACEDQQEAAGAITMASEERRHAECEIHWGHAKSSKRLRLLEYFTKNTSELEEKSVSGEFFYLEFIQ